MQTRRRPENMERINTPALAQAFIDERSARIWYVYMSTTDCSARVSPSRSSKSSVMR